VSKKNLMEIVKKLMIHMDKAEGTSYRDELLSKIIEICSQNNYQHITNFEWYFIEFRHSFGINSIIFLAGM
jgi:AP-3 complex subunit delta